MNYVNKTGEYEIFIWNLIEFLVESDRKKATWNATRNNPRKNMNKQQQQEQSQIKSDFDFLLQFFV